MGDVATARELARAIIFEVESLARDLRAPQPWGVLPGPGGKRQLFTADVLDELARRLRSRFGF